MAVERDSEKVEQKQQLFAVHWVWKLGKIRKLSKCGCCTSTVWNPDWIGFRHELAVCQLQRRKREDGHDKMRIRGWETVMMMGTRIPAPNQGPRLFLTAFKAERTTWFLLGLIYGTYLIGEFPGIRWQAANVSEPKGRSIYSLKLDLRRAVFSWESGPHIFTAIKAQTRSTPSYIRTCVIETKIIFKQVLKWFVIEQTVGVNLSDLA